VKKPGERIKRICRGCGNGFWDKVTASNNYRLYCTRCSELRALTSRQIYYERRARDGKRKNQSEASKKKQSRYQKLVYHGLVKPVKVRRKCLRCPSTILVSIGDKKARALCRLCEFRQTGMASQSYNEIHPNHHGTQSYRDSTRERSRKRRRLAQAVVS